MRSYFIALCLAVGGLSSSRAANFSGNVIDPQSQPIPDVQVAIPALKAGTVTNSSGTFTLDIPAGAYAVAFHRLGYADQALTVRVPGAGPLSVTLNTSALAAVLITISAAPTPSTVMNTPAEVSVVQGRQLDQQRAESVMSAIQNEPGVNLIAEGPTVVKPIIRGLSSQNLVIAEDGVREEFIQWGNEHAPEIDATSADSIEVIRGPESLMYGSDALGGVINVNHAPLPSTALGAGPLSGKITANADSVNNGVSDGVMLQGAQGAVGWRTDLSQQQTGNFATGNEGIIPNTAENGVSGDGALELTEDWGNVTGSYSHFHKYVELQNGYIYPASLDDPEYQVLTHDHAILNTNILTDLANFNVVGAYDRSDRQEYNGETAANSVPTGSYSDLGAYWIDTTYTTNSKAQLEPMGPLQGTLGLDTRVQNEQDLAPTYQLTPSFQEVGFGEYLYEDLPLNKFDFTAGVRGDENHYGVDADPLVSATALETATGLGAGEFPSGSTANGVAATGLNYAAVTAGVGGVYHITSPLAFAVNVGRGYRNPIPFELFGYGIHEGAGVFQVGDPSLQPETSLDTDASLRWASDRLKGEVGVYRNYIQDYIYGNFTGAWAPNYDLSSYPTTPCTPSESGCLPVVQETQGNATIQGVDYTVTGAATDWLTLTSEGGLVRGFNNTSDPALPNDYLPEIPADSVRFAATVHEKQLGVVQNPYFGMDEKLTASQNRVAPYELPTGVSAPGYALMGARIGGEFIVMNNQVTVDAGVSNLLNKGYIDYTSLLMDYNIEDPGRDVYIKISVPFGS